MVGRFSSRLHIPARDNPLSRAFSSRRLSGAPLLNLSDSNPTSVGLGLDENLLLDALRNPDNLVYEPDPRGLRRTREAICGLSGNCMDPDSLFLCASSSEAYAWAFKLLCDPCDYVFVPKPGYPLFDSLAGLECVMPHPYRLEYSHPQGWRIDMDELSCSMRRLKPKALVLIHPNNPTGSYVRERERGHIIELCAQNSCALIVDEVFLGCGLDDAIEPSFAGERGVLTLVLNGFSKLMALPQLKLGWMAVSGPDNLREEAIRRLEIIADTYLSVGAPAMNAVPVLLAHAQSLASSVRTRCLGNLQALRACFDGAPSPYRILRCSGGWSAVLEMPCVMSEESLAIEILEKEGVSAHPGYFYDFEREGYLVVSLIVREDVFMEGITRIKKHLDGIIR